MNQNYGTAYGLDHNIANIKTREDLVRQHPLTVYSHYEKYAERVAKGEKNVMTKDDIAILAVSSGTTGKNKTFPFTVTSYKQLPIIYMSSAYLNFSALLGCYGLQRMFQFRMFHPPVVNAYGVREGGVGNVIARPRSSNLTPLCFLKAPNEPVSFYIQSVFALAEREVGVLDGYSSDLWYALFKFMSTHKSQICDAIETGALLPFPGLDEELRLEASASLKADPARAEEVRRALSGPVKGFAKRIWPNVANFACAKSGGFAHSAQLLQESYASGIRMIFIGHIATEGLFGKWIYF